MGRKKEVVYYNGRLAGKYLSGDTCKRLDVLMKLDEEKGCVEDLKNIICELPNSVIEEIIRTRSSDNVDLDKYKGKLENHQTIGVAYMYMANRLILGDSVGMGKTVEVCGLINLLKQKYMSEYKEFRFLYLTGKNILEQAQKEMIRFTGEYVYPLYGDKASVTRFVNNNYSELNYSVVGAHSLVNSVHFQEYLRGFNLDGGGIPFDILIIDESGDILSNSATATYKNAVFVSKFFDRIVLLNATVFEKELRAFYSQLNFIDETFLPTKTAFQKEYEIYNYTTAYPTFSGKYKNAEKFRDLVSYRYLARTRKGSGATMTNCTAESIIVPLSKDQKWLLSRTSMPQMVYDCPSYFNMGVETDPVTTPKLKALLRLLTVTLKDADSILIYSRYKEAQRCIQEALYNEGIYSCILNGDSPQSEREATINRFKLGDIRVLITNVQKGLNFGHCNYCIFYTYDPNPNKMVQFEGRMTRSFNIDNKHVYLLLSEGNEQKTFEGIISDRAKASDLFAGSDFSCVLSILLAHKHFEEDTEVSVAGSEEVESAEDVSEEIEEDEVLMPDGEVVLPDGTVILPDEDLV